MANLYPEIKKNFGFGCMRFPKIGEEVDISAVRDMVDTFLAAGFNYFDTARPYHGGASESVLKEVLTSRYPRESYVLTNKLSPTQFETEEEIRPLFESQLEKCGVEYFDFYLLHNINLQSVHLYLDPQLGGDLPSAGNGSQRKVIKDLLLFCQRKFKAGCRSPAER